MFALIAGSRVDALQSAITGMGAALRGDLGSPRFFLDDTRGFAVCESSSGILPEDRFDTQPYVDDELCFVAHVRIDNPDDVLDRLGRVRLQHTGLPDAALLRMAYQRWGVDCGRYLAGQYSFCALHRESGEIVAGADHLGTVRLFYSQIGGVFIAATQMGAMLSHPLLRHAEPDVKTTALLIPGTSFLEGTAFRDVSYLAGGHALQRSPSGEIKTHRWWDARIHSAVRYKHLDEYVQHATSVFTASVKARLRAVGNISATVSGGLDSSLVAAAAAVELGKTNQGLAMYTSVPEPGIAYVQRPDWDADESDLVRDLAAQHPNTTHALVRFNGVNPIDVMRETHALSHTPVRNTANQVWFRSMCHMAREGDSRVLLTGQWGNATVSLSGVAMIGRLLLQKPLLALDLMRQNRRNGGQRVRSLLLGELRALRNRLQDRKELPYGERYLTGAARQQLEPLAIARADVRDPAVQEEFATRSFPGCYRDELVHSGVEFRDPTSDKRLIELLLSFPPEAFLAGGRMRGLAREMGSHMVPDSIRLRRRRGMQVPDLCGLIALHGDAYQNALHSMKGSAACRENLQLDLAQFDLDRLCRGELDLLAATMLDRVIDVGLFWTEHGI
jgi:asparagine synthase (glutamine-hydrolysing)